MSWYLGKPSTGDVLTFTVHEPSDIGFRVTLDAYSGTEGFLPFSELSSKKIKKNPASFLRPSHKHAGVVTDSCEAMTYISLKSVSKAQQEQETKQHANNERLFALCQRLAHLSSIAEHRWRDCFQYALDLYRKDGYTLHPFEAIVSRQVSDDDVFLPSELLDTIVSHHATLFGMKPASLVILVTILTFDMNGNDRVKSVLSSMMSGRETRSDAQLYQSPEKYNLTINPVALPDFQIVISAYLENACQSAADYLIDRLRMAKFDIMEVKKREFMQ